FSFEAKKKEKITIVYSIRHVVGKDFRFSTTASYIEDGCRSVQRPRSERFHQEPWNSLLHVAQQGN
ncbi:hypothetical protein NPIL_181341, partial [Nephila pilipes]